jgi:hypothetical protein
MERYKMIQLEKPCQREMIPGLRQLITTKVRARSLAMTNLNKASFGMRDRDKILSAFDLWTHEQVYQSSPFYNVIERYPGTSDVTKLYDFEKELARHTGKEKDMNEWANKIISMIQEELWPKKKW